MIVAINIPLALLFAFTALYFRGKSANLLSIGAVDFGIIVDSSVIITENIYRRLASGEDAGVPLKTRIFRAASEIDRALLFSTLIMVCAFIPLFALEGPAGPCSDRWRRPTPRRWPGRWCWPSCCRPCLCLLLFKNLKPTADNFFVRFIKHTYLIPLIFCLKHRWLTVLFFASAFAATLCLLPLLGQEFMPELEEGNLWIRDTCSAEHHARAAGGDFQGGPLHHGLLSRGP